MPSIIIIRPALHAKIHKFEQFSIESVIDAWVSDDETEDDSEEDAYSVYSDECISSDDDADEAEEVEYAPLAKRLRTQI